MSSREMSVHERRDKAKRETWIKNVMSNLKYTREKAEAEYERIFKTKANGSQDD